MHKPKPNVVTANFWPTSRDAFFNALRQECESRGLLGATLHVGNRAKCRMMFFNLEITTSPGNGLYNVAHSEIDLKKKVITSPASPYHRPSSGFVNQKSSSVARSEVH